MKEKLKSIFKGPVVFYPLLFAIFPILFLYAYNISETTVNQIVIPMSISLAFTLVLWAILSLILRSILKAGLAATIFLLFFFSYGHFYIILENWDVLVPKHVYLLPAVLLIYGYCVYFIKIAHRNFMTTTKVLNVIAVALIAINLFNIAADQVQVTNQSAGSQPTGAGQEAAVAIDSENLKNMPDIYYIVLDGYSNPRSIAEQFNYDNSQFVNKLISKGFFIANGSKTRSHYTHISLATSLNMEYISETETPAVVYPKVSNNKVEQLLKSHGYRYIHIGTWWTPTMYSSDADVNVNFYKSTEQGTVAVEFMAVLWNTTMLRPFYNYVYANQNQNFFRYGLTNTLDFIKKAPTIDGPKFVFAHIICPHAPFVFGPNGDIIVSANWYNNKFYLGQYIYITREIEQVIDMILTDSSEPPIIILQSDHGIGVKWEHIFNAYYLPDGGEKQLYDTISPVNSFRVVFNHYFGANYELLDD